MAATANRLYRWSLHPLHAVLLAATLTLFLAALLSDIAYGESYEVQWTNFASWLIAGGLVFGAFAFLWALIDLIRADDRRGRPLVYFLLVLATWVLGFINALIHAKDVWASMPDGLILSAIVVVLAVAATWIGFSTLREGATR
ncbi:DUF2231 domain-containing protein [Enterovirga sp. GCM10030262]|uniref:DUF2231 domain-containing protein n=1 Tax=Enterovirga sp. GCM10030262 TaxID=3273391 RepID=UPI00361267C7